MAAFTRTIDIAAPRGVVWRVLMDVERWPAWTQSVAHVERVDGRPLALGSRVRIQQPRLRAAFWTVTAFDPEHRFEWQSGAPGLRVIASHALEDAGPGCRVTLDLRYSGATGWLVALLAGRMTRGYMAMEAEGLKRRSEQVR